IEQFALSQKVDVVVIGPEDPLANGLTDRLENAGLKVFGPSKLATQIESSKAFSKEFMMRHNIPTAKGESFDNSDDAIAYIKKVGAPIVVKADGLAKGKGVFPCRELKKAVDAVKAIMIDKEFGDAGDKIIIEEFMEGEEASFIAFTDGKTVLPTASSQDHKPIFDGDKGPNTGGMGAYSPAPVVTDEVYELIMETIMKPTVKGMAEEGYIYRGALYAGLMIKDGKPKVVEFNARFGDPETQAVIPRMKSDIMPAILACIDGTLDKVSLEWTDEPAVCVAMVSGGYPASYEKGKVINGLDQARNLDKIIVFHAGTAEKDGKVVTSGGRVLGITALGNTIKDAIDLAYKAINEISFDGAYYRKDIGYRALNK
ncbi:TPA: phosphoribosylamine--glycine ligase, partial [bacterium]|nr:phosphoribosylamine--glycine ligase [bacterium]